MNEREPRATVTTHVSHTLKRVRAPILFFLGIAANLLVICSRLTGTLILRFDGPIMIIAGLFLIGCLCFWIHPIGREILWDKDSYMNLSIGTGLLLMALIHWFRPGPIHNSTPIEASNPAVKWHAPNEGQAGNKMPTDAELKRQNEQLK